jgi:hypothetical protein
MTVVVRPFTADRLHFFERLRSERDAADAALSRAHLRASSASYCRLIDPLSEEDAQVELLIPVDEPSSPPPDITLRKLAAVSYAVIDVTASVRVADFSAHVDALFDWFDRHGYRAIDLPWLARTLEDGDLRTEILWAYEGRARGED